MIWFILKRKWKLYFTSDNIHGIISQCVTSVIILLLYIFGGAIYQFTFDAKNYIESEAVLTTLNRISVSLPAIFCFFPSIKHKENLFQPFYPISPLRKSCIELVVSIFSKTLIYVLFLSSLSLFIIFKDFLLIHFLNLLISCTVGILFAELFITLVSSNNKSILLVLIILFLLLTYFEGAFSYGVNTLITAMLLIANLYLGVYYSFQYNSHISRYKGYWIFGRDWVQTILSNNKVYKVAVLYAILFQTIMTFTISKFALPEIPFLNYFSVIPLGIYTYCYNNIWGFFPSLAINHVLAGKNIREFILVYIKLLSPALIACQITVLLASYFGGQHLTLKMLLVILITNAFAIINGLWFSFTSMKKIEKGISLKDNFYNSDLTPTHILGIICILFGVLENHVIIFALLLVVVSLVAVLQYYILTKYSSYFINKFKYGFIQNK
ncbi:MAG: hypothetical protein KF862_23090 [Chitinophagaceae bacterium]|nr:hypothetical protein [Chitinophagaceae bacterium]